MAKETRGPGERTTLELRGDVVDLLREFGLEKREQPFRLSSGQWSHDYIDGKRALADGKRLRVVGEALLDLAGKRGLEFDAVGGLTMGADALAHAVSLLSGCTWFSVRKEAKGHGKESLVEGGLDEGMRVLLVDDVVTTGGSILQALDAVTAAGARVVLAVSVCDRGPDAGPLIAERGIAYEPLVTFEDLGIEPVTGEPAGSS
ncbi:MAG TPA: orotate phosphoribosyltransferase [Actinomycetota bacterium]